MCLFAFDCDVGWYFGFILCHCIMFSNRLCTLFILYGCDYEFHYAMKIVYSMHIHSSFVFTADEFFFSLNGEALFSILHFNIYFFRYQTATNEKTIAQNNLFINENKIYFIWK